MRIMVFFVVLASLAGLLLYSKARTEPLRVSGFIEADDVRVGSRVGGRIRRVLVEEGSRVAKGELLVELEAFDLLEHRAEAEALLAGRRADRDRLASGFRAEEIAQAQARKDELDAQLRQLESGPRQQEIATGKARVEQAEAQLDLARQEHARAVALKRDEMVSQDAVDRTLRELRVAEATLDVSQHELSLLEEGTRKEEIEQARARLAEADAALALVRSGYRVEEITAAEAAVTAAAAALDAIDRRIEELAIRAPVDGVVEAVDLRPGDLVRESAPVISLIDPTRLWVRAYVPEGLLTVRHGDVLRVTVDPYPDRSFTGQVGFIAQQAEFTPRNVQTPDERSKQVFRIKVMLEGTGDLLRPGMSADVWLEADGD